MPAKPMRISIRISTDAFDRLAQLQEIWGPVVPLSQAEAIEHALAIALAREKKKTKNSQTTVDKD